MKIFFSKSVAHEKKVLFLPQFKRLRKMKAVKSNDKRRAMVNKEFIIRLDGETNLFGETITIHSAVGYEKANNIGGLKFQEIIDKAIKKGGEICKLKINHKLTCTLYRH